MHVLTIQGVYQPPTLVLLPFHTELAPSLISIYLLDGKMLLLKECMPYCQYKMILPVADKHLAGGSTYSN